MSPVEIGIAGVAGLLAAIFLLRLPVGFSMALVGFLGFWKVVNLNAALGMVGEETWKTLSSYGLTVIPLFILMGQICFHSGVNERMYKAANAWIGHIRGGLAMATILACAGFAAICGSNTATAATMSTVSLPQMNAYRYDRVFSSGVIAAGSTLGVMIPPSVVLIIIGLQTGQAIGVLFWAALVPGLLLLGCFLLAVRLLCARRPELSGAPAERATLREKLLALPGAVEMLLLFVLVMAGLILGAFTPSEAGAAGAGLALLLSLLGGKLGPRELMRAVDDTLRISCMIMVIVLGAIIFGRFLTITRIPHEIATAVASWSVPPALIMLGVFGIYLLGGAIMDALALLLITIPIFFPLAESLGYDPVWFGVWITLVPPMGAIPPPVGINTYIVASMEEGVSLPQVFRGVTPFLLCFLACALILLAWPGLALWLPGVLA